jgi:acyl-CoA thioesterase-1
VAQGSTRSAGIRVAVVGDELVAGVGDARAQGWVGRVAARTGPAAQLFALGVPGEGTSALSARWSAEAKRRYSDSGTGSGAADNRLVIGLGHADLYTALSLARSRLNLANILDEALAGEVRTFVIGPPPGLDAEYNQKVSELSAGFADVATRRGVGYVDTFTPLLGHEQWRSDLAVSGGRNPGQAGYGLMAWLVLHRGWFDWLGVAEPA